MFVEQLQNTGPLLKVYIREWLAGSAVAVVLEERGRYIREWLGGSVGRRLDSGLRALRM